MRYRLLSPPSVRRCGQPRRSTTASTVVWRGILDRFCGAVVRDPPRRQRAGRRLFILALTAAAFTLPLARAAVAETPIVTLSIQDHRFHPEELTVPAGTKVKLIVRNLDPTPEEFESYDLNREKVIAGGSEVTIFIGPLDPGTYGFFGEFNMDTAQGRIVAK